MSALENCNSSAQDSSVHCKVCNAPFPTLQDCLAHELLKHTIKPQKKLRKCLDTVTKLLASNQIQCERRELQAALLQAQHGQHLCAVVNFYAGSCNKLTACYFQVHESLQKQLYNKVKVYPFGSLVTGLSLKDSDIDLYLEQNDTSAKSLPQRQLFNRVHKLLRNSSCFQDVFAIRHARVPIVRCKHVQTGVSLDINMTSPKSTHNSRFFAELLNRDVRIRELFLFLKIWAKKLKLIGSGSMTSYCLMTLIIYGMQQQRQLPPIKMLQIDCPVMEVLGINYGYSLQDVPPLPDSLCTFDLISNFFELYSQMDFDKKLISPYMGYALDVETIFAVPANFPEYHAQLHAMERATGEQPEQFQSQRCVCVQDPFELQHNVGQSISQSNLCYLRECFALAAQACNNQKLTSTSNNFYDYLLFGLAETLLQEKRLEQVKPAKQRKQVPSKQELTHTKPPLVETIETKAATPATHTAAQETTPSSTTADHAPLQLLTHMLTPTNNDLKCLRAELLTKSQTEQHIFYYWAKCYMDAIKDIVSNIYAINMQLIDTELSDKPNKLPRRLTWQISTNLDTWTLRNFQRPTKQSCFAQQLQQTVKFRKTRTDNESFAVKLNGRLSFILAQDYKELRLELQPLSADKLGLQRQSPLTKFFKSLKNMISFYNFKENVASLQFSKELF